MPEAFSTGHKQMCFHFLIHIYRRSLGFAALYFGCNSQLAVGPLSGLFTGNVSFSAIYTLSVLTPSRRADFAISAGRIIYFTITNENFEFVEFCNVAK
ncbi:hypothetical protein T07_10209 [Trichinella nelsoni]|uniref:Uncharacterized protein n=1 Tax=Trichinella nelsoni TaxID=6336 RepID=A0A0V0RL23_9BILA|nr:hypothetical protein T07_10209 [Trichinella nelsoni]